MYIIFLKEFIYRGQFRKGKGQREIVRIPLFIMHLVVITIGGQCGILHLATKGDYGFS